MCKQLEQNQYICSSIVENIFFGKSQRRDYKDSSLHQGNQVTFKTYQTNGAKIHFHLATQFFLTEHQL